MQLGEGMKYKIMSIKTIVLLFLHAAVFAETLRVDTMNSSKGTFHLIF